MNVAPGATSQSITVQLVDDTGLPVTGKVAATFPATYYQRLNAAAVAITLSDLAAITSAYSSGGVHEITGGFYRLDVPDLGYATATVLQIIGEATGMHVLYPPVVVAYVQSNVIEVGGTAQTAKDLGASTTQSGDTFARLGAPAGANVSADIAAINSKTTNLPAAPADETLVIAATDAVMARLGAPSGASVSADLAEANADLDELITTIGVAGAGLTGVPGVSDPLASAVPGAYAEHTAGAALGKLDEFVVGPPD